MAKEGNGSRDLTTRSSVDKLKRRLYARGNDESINADIRTPLEPQEYETPVSWNQPPPPSTPTSSPMRPVSSDNGLEKKRMSFAAKFLIGSSIFFILAAATAIFVFFGGTNLISPQNIDIQIVTPSLIDGGKEATFQILITNHNTASLQLADLLITYPEGTRDPKDPSKVLQYARESVGTVEQGQQVKRSISGIFFGQEGAVQKVQAILQYSLEGSNAVFERKAEATFLVGSSPISLTVDTPLEAVAGEPFEIIIVAKNNTTEPVSNVVVQGQFPFGFATISSQPQVSPGIALWRLGTMAPGSKQTIRLVGRIDGQDGDERVLRFLIGSNKDQTDTKVSVPFLTVPSTLTIRRPFISGSITVEGKTGKTVAVTSGRPVQGTVTWQNNLSDSISDVQLSLSIVGPVLDKSSVQVANGFYQSLDSTIIWTKDYDPALAQVPPGGTATLQFSFATLPPGSGGTVFSNPTVDLNLTIRGVRIGEGNVPQEVTSAAFMQVTLASALSLAAQSMHFSGPFSNVGTMPPRVESDTSYTIVWTVKNSSNTVANAAVATVLPPYVRYIRGESGITYEEGSRTVKWNIGDLKAGVGFNLPSQSAAFQVVLTPSLSQVNQSPTLTGSATFTGQDRFAQIGVQASVEAPTIRLSGDNSYQSSMGIVSQ